jgi:type IV pilus assembly protein PilW
MKSRHPQIRCTPALARGVTLIELMVAVVLGLIVSGAALTLFLTNKQTYNTSESLGRIQESERTAFELMARDVREAAGNACEKGLAVANIIKPANAKWYTDFGSGIQGYDGAMAFGDAAFGTGTGNRVAGTDAIELKSSVSDGVVITQAPSGGAPANLWINTQGNLVPGDIVMACNFDHGVVFQIDDINGAGGLHVIHNTASSKIPGNSSNGLGNPAGTNYDYGLVANQPAAMAKLRATRWYVGYNGRTYNGQASKSLYQTTLKNTGGNVGVVNNEITEGVGDMQMKYLVAGAKDYVDAAAGTDWTKVVAVRIDVTLEGNDKVGTDLAVLQRHLQHVVTLRNRAL